MKYSIAPPPKYQVTDWVKVKYDNREMVAYIKSIDWSSRNGLTYNLSGIGFQPETIIICRMVEEK